MDLDSPFYPTSAAVLALGGCTILVGSMVRRRRTGAAPGSQALILLFALAAASLLLWTRGVYFLWTLRGHLHDQVHYVINSKYYDEVGQFDLYPALVVAGAEANLPLRVTLIRDMHTYEVVSAQTALSRATEIKERFTADRWAEFKGDVAAFHGLVRTLPANVANRKWQEIVLDKGYNATPAWTLIAGAVSNAIGFRHRFSSVLYASIDVMLLAAMFVAIGRVYGAWPCAVAALFLGCNCLCKFVEIGGGFLRFDWIAALMIGMCGLRRERYAWAGVLIGYACAVRVFPCLFAAPAAIVAARSFFRNKRLDPGQWRFLGGFLVTVAVMLAGAGIRYGPACWRQFQDKINVHVAEYGFKRIGLETAFLYTGSSDASYDESLEDFERFKKTKKSRRDDTEVWIRMAQSVMLAAWLAVMLIRPMTSDEAAMMGFVLVCTLLSPTRYYYIMLLAPIVVLAAWWPATGALVGLLYLFASQIAGNLLERAAALAATQQFVQCLLVSGFAALLIGITYGHLRKPATPPPEE